MLIAHFNINKNEFLTETKTSHYSHNKQIKMKRPYIISYLISSGFVLKCVYGQYKVRGEGLVGLKFGYSNFQN